MNKVQMLAADLVIGHMTYLFIYHVTADHKNVYVNNTSRSRVEDVLEVSLCLSCQDASTDMFLRV